MKSTVRGKQARLPHKSERAALLIVHGMGQQARFSTLDGLIRGLFDAAVENKNPPTLEHVVTEGATDTDSHVRICFTNELPHCKAKQLDVYEAYWAPLAQRKLKAPRVLAWLGTTSLTPLRSWATDPDAFVSGDEANATRTRGPYREIVRAALLPLVFLVIVLPLVLVLRYLDEIKDLGKTANKALPDGFWSVADVVAPAVFGLLALGLLGVGVKAAVRKKRDDIEAKTLSAQAWAAVSTGAVMAIIAFGIELIGNNSLEDYLRAVDDDLVTGSLVGTLVAVVVANAVRGFLVDSLGDVSIYVTADEKSDLYETRANVLETASKIASNLLDNYEAVYIAGHSLGSVIAYDTVNRLQRDYRALGTTAGSNYTRLQGLFTFGSPLDKIEYFFRTKVGGDQAVRAQILSSLHGFERARTHRVYDPYKFQPYEIRVPGGFWWTNYYCLADPVSGRLDRYRPNEQCDTQYKIPLKAHTSYWTDPAFFKHIYSRL